MHKSGPEAGLQQRDRRGSALSAEVRHCQQSTWWKLGDFKWNVISSIRSFWQWVRLYVKSNRRKKYSLAEYGGLRAIHITSSYMHPLSRIRLSVHPGPTQTLLDIVECCLRHIWTCHIPNSYWSSEHNSPWRPARKTAVVFADPLWCIGAGYNQPRGSFRDSNWALGTGKRRLHTWLTLWSSFCAVNNYDWVAGGD